MGREVTMNFITSQFTGMEIGNKYQLPMFWEVKQEVFIVFPLAQKGYQKSKCISNYFQLLGIYANITNQYSCYSGYFSYIKKNKTITKSVTVKQIRFLGCFHLLLHLLQKLNLLMKHVGRKLSCFSDMSSTRKSRSHCSRDRETPGSSEAAARYIASRYLSAVSPNFFKYQVLAMPRFEVVFPYFAALLNICGWVVLRNL